MEHTPGPWWLITADDEHTIHAPGHGTIIATAHPLMPEYPANARLIAAAPELLSALEDMVRIHPGGVEGDICVGTECLCQRARAAIKQAKGD